MSLTGKNNHGNTAILLVETNDSLRAALGESIEDNGYQLLGASGSADALQHCGKANIAIVDLILDDIDGLSLIEDIRARQKEVRIIAALPSRSARKMLDMEDKDIIKMAQQSGANAVFIAPFNLGELLTTVERFAETEATAA